LHDFEDRFGAIGEVDVRVDTVGGLVAEKLGRMAEVGDEVMVQGEGQQVHFTVLACSETRPLVLTVRLEEEENPAGSEELA
jgi:Mg2+/Co2+ transporter CorC